MKTTLAESTVYCNRESLTAHERHHTDGPSISGIPARVGEFQESGSQHDVGLGLDDKSLLHEGGRSWADIPQKVKKRKKHAPAWARLKGFLQRRLKGKAIWVKLDFKAFEELTGLSERQIRRAKATLAANDPDLVFRTIVIGSNKNCAKSNGRGWEVLVSTKEKLKYDNEPLFESEDGRSRHVRRDLLSPDIDGLPDTLCNKGPKGQQIETTTAAPKLNFVNNSGLIPATPKLKRFAHFLKNLLVNRHWDNCKILFKPAHAYNYVLKGLRMGAERDDILFAYGGALESRHGDATDYGLNNGDPTVKWEPSSTVSLAMDILKRIMKRKKEGTL